MIHFLVPGQHADMIQDYKDRLGDWGEESMAASTYQDAVKRKEFPPGRYVFTGLDRLGPHTSNLFGELHERLEAQLGVPPLNHPTESLRRYELLKALSEADLNQFRAMGAWEDHSRLRYPVFVRHRSQDGGVPELLSSQAAIEREIGRLLMSGATMDEILVVEFLDTSDSAGLFRKFAAYFIEGQVLPVAMACGRKWVLRGHSNELTKASIDEEKGYVEDNPHEEQISSIFQIAKIDFGRIDYSLFEGRVQTWEINTLPLQRRPAGLEPPPEELRVLREYKQTLNEQRFSVAWKEVDSKDRGGSPVLASFQPEVLREAEGELAGQIPPTYPQGPRYAFVRFLLRPIKPIIKPLAVKILYPLLSKKARTGKKKAP